MDRGGPPAHHQSPAPSPLPAWVPKSMIFKRKSTRIADRSFPKYHQLPAASPRRATGESGEEEDFKSCFDKATIVRPRAPPTGRHEKHSRGPSVGLTPVRACRLKPPNSGQRHTPQIPRLPKKKQAKDVSNACGSCCALAWSEPSEISGASPGRVLEPDCLQLNTKLVGLGVASFRNGRNSSHLSESERCESFFRFGKSHNTPKR